MKQACYAFEEALRLAKDYEEPEPACLEVDPGPASGHGCTEAPRGICYHRYDLDERGRILLTRIMPPTAQNQKQIEDDLWKFLPKFHHLEQAELTLRCEQAVRNYDPCISCATHFIKLDLDRA